MPKVTQAHEQKRRHQILSAAMVCFARQGYRATSMEDIVRESGLSVGAIYSYFSSKEELFLALADRHTQQTVENIDRLFSRPGPMQEKTGEAIDYFFDMLAGEIVPLVRISFEFWSESARSERLHEREMRRCDVVRQLYRRLLEGAHRQGLLRPGLQIDTAAELLMALNEGIIMLHVNGLRSVPVEALKAAYVQFVNLGFCGAPTDDQVFLVPSTAAVTGPSPAGPATLYPNGTAAAAPNGAPSDLH